MENTWEKENRLFGSKDKRSANEEFFTKRKECLSLLLLLLVRKHRATHRDK